MSLGYRAAASILLVLVIACGGDAEETPPQQAAPPIGEAPQMGQSNEGDITEVAEYRLTMDAVQKMHRAQLNIYEAMQQDPQLAQMASMSAEEFSLDAMEQRFGSVPGIRTAIEEAGLSVREYGVIMLALFQASFAQASLEMGAQRDTVLAATHMNPDNLEFVEQNRDALRQMQDELEAASRRAGAPE